MQIDYKAEIERLKQKLDVTIVAHYYQKDEVFEMGDIVGDSLELARKCQEDKAQWVVFCGVGFMGQSVKVIAPQKRVVMPRVAECSMASMINAHGYDASLEYLEGLGIKSEALFPVTYINSDVGVKAKVGKMGGMVCTSSNAYKIIDKALKSQKQVFFLPDRCLGQNFANEMGLKSAIIGTSSDEEIKAADIICYDGFCATHQLFTLEDIKQYKERYEGIKIAVHPECDPAIVQASDFAGSTSQLIAYVDALDKEQKVAVGTEYNLVKRMRKENTYVLASTKPECPTMNETTLKELYEVLKSIEDENPINEIFVDEEVAQYAKEALDRMLAVK